MTKKWSSVASGTGDTKREASKAARRGGRVVDYSEEITMEQAAKIDELVAPEFATGDWQTVEKE